jgi:hypothetical protein
MKLPVATPGVARMEVSALADIVLSLLLIGAVWLAGAAFIKAADFLEIRSAAAKARSRDQRG